MFSQLALVKKSLFTIQMWIPYEYFYILLYKHISNIVIFNETHRSLYTILKLTDKPFKTIRTTALDNKNFSIVPIFATKKGAGDKMHMHAINHHCIYLVMHLFGVEQFRVKVLCLWKLASTRTRDLESCLSNTYHFKIRGT